MSDVVPDLDFGAKKKKKKMFSADMEPPASAPAAIPDLDFGEKKKKKKSTASSSSSSSSSSKVAPSGSTDTTDAGAGGTVASADVALDLSGEKKKKKKSSSKKTGNDEGRSGAAATAAVAAGAAGGSADVEEAGVGEAAAPSTKKSSSKKKGKSSAATADGEASTTSRPVSGADDAETAAAAAALPADSDSDSADEAARAAAVDASGDADEPMAGCYSYNFLLQRVLDIMVQRNIGGGVKKRTLKPPQVVKDGARKTAFTNFMDICKSMNRDPDHVMSYVLSELGTTGNLDGNEALIIRGRFQQKNVTAIIRRYINDYVVCHMCKSLETRLTKDAATRLNRLECQTCNASRSVQSINKGYTAVIKRPRK